MCADQCSELIYLVETGQDDLLLQRRAYSNFGAFRLGESQVCRDGNEDQEL